MKGNTSYIARGNVLKELSYSFNYINKSFKYLKNLVKHKKKIIPAAQWILDNIRKCENPFTCPHGRPTIITYTKYDLEKLFKRSLD